MMFLRKVQSRLVYSRQWDAARCKPPRLLCGTEPTTASHGAPTSLPYDKRDENNRKFPGLMIMNIGLECFIVKAPA